jgi:hypothetical protein
MVRTGTVWNGRTKCTSLRDIVNSNKLVDLNASLGSCREVASHNLKG